MYGLIWKFLRLWILIFVNFSYFKLAIYPKCKFRTDEKCQKSKFLIFWNLQIRFFCEIKLQKLFKVPYFKLKIFRNIFCEIINSKICEAKLKINYLYFFREISFKNVENPLYILFFVKSSNLQKISLIQRKIWFLITVILQRIFLSRLFNQLVV